MSGLISMKMIGHYDHLAKKPKLRQAECLVVKNRRSSRARDDWFPTPQTKSIFFHYGKDRAISKIMPHMMFFGKGFLLGFFYIKNYLKNTHKIILKGYDRMMNIS